ncbi:MAG TPA: prephenate dehydrogenase [Bryobacteraceae bacterium]|nr:prephenate dehydrogenase [Bryobacteraceae bacterium]
MQSPAIRTITIYGVGLIGGSFALALRRAGFAGRILGVSSPSTLEEATALGVIDEGVSFEEGASKADLIYLAQPISKIIEQLPRIAPHARPGALLTDAGSTKVQIVRAAAACLPPGSFWGGHPMAGKETRGVAAAEASLFEGRVYVLTPTTGSNPAAEELLEWIGKMGAVVRIMSPEDHDETVSVTSHLAQLASTVLTQTVIRGVPYKTFINIAGPGLLDMTRLAMSSFEVWKDIIATNEEPIKRALSRYIEHLQYLRENLAGPDTENTFSEAGAAAKLLRGFPVIDNPR